MDASGYTGAEPRLRVLIAAGGVAALEVLLALCHHAPGRFDRDRLIAPDPEFRYRPLSVTEPFQAATPRHADLAEIALEHGHSFRKDALAAVDPGRRVLSTTGGAEL